MNEATPIKHIINEDIPLAECPPPVYIESLCETDDDVIVGYNCLLLDTNEAKEIRELLNKHLRNATSI
jgi:hypothetical protein